MTVESGKYIGSMNPDYPEVDDPVAEGDDHLRSIKLKLVETLPGKDGNGFAKPIVATEDELNFVEGVTSPIQTQINDLPTKFVGKSGNQTIDGRLTIVEHLTIVSDGDEVGDGIRINGTDGNLQAAFKFDETDLALYIRQQGTGPVGTPDTEMKFTHGRVSVTPANGFTGDPISDYDLVNKKYFEANTISIGETGDAEIEGTLWVHEEVRVLADTGAGGNGYSIYAPDPSDNDVLKIRAVTYFETSDETYRFGIADSGGNAQTMMIYYPEGELRIDGAVVLTTANSAALHGAFNSAGGVSGTFEDNTGKTITVTDGLITDLG